MPSLEQSGSRAFGHLAFSPPASGCDFVSSGSKATQPRMDTFLKRPSSLSQKDRVGLFVSRARKGPWKAMPLPQRAQAGSGMTFS